MINDDNLSEKIANVKNSVFKRLQEFEGGNNNDIYDICNILDIQNDKMNQIIDMFMSTIGSLITPRDIKIHYHYDKYPEFTYVSEKHGNMYDLATAEKVELFENDYKEISLGISLDLPEGYLAILVPRSSTFKKYGIIQANSIGIIDEDYKGMEDIWKFPAYATRHVAIPINTRICQFTILPEWLFKLVAGDWTASNRGGFGSSDKK